MWKSGNITIDYKYREQESTTFKPLSMLIPQLDLESSDALMTDMVKQQKKGNSESTTIRLLLAIILLVLCFVFFGDGCAAAL